MMATRAQNWVELLRKPPTVVYDLLALCIFLSLFAPNFFNVTTALTVGVQTAVLLIVALEETLVILTEGIDLSAGAVLSVAGVVAAYLLQAGIPLPIAFLAALATGVTFGLLNGCLIAVGKLPPFITTLGTMGVAQGLALVMTEGLSINSDSPQMRFFGEGVLLGLPTPVWIAALVLLLTYVLLNNTRYGIGLYAIGWKEETARRAGINVTKEKVILYALGGGMVAIAGFLLVARMSSAHPTVGLGYEFDGIAAALLGGTSFSQGRGGLGGTLLGALFVTTLKTGLNILHVTTYLQLGIIGVILVLAIVLETVAKQRGWREG